MQNKEKSLTDGETLALQLLIPEEELVERSGYFCPQMTSAWRDARFDDAIEDEEASIGTPRIKSQQYHWT